MDKELFVNSNYDGAEKKVKNKEKKKRQFYLVDGEKALISKKKKVSTEPALTNVRQNYGQCHQYKNTDNYITVVAKPEVLPSTPKIFHQTWHKKKLGGSSKFFFLDFLTGKCFNTDVNSRFSFIDHWKISREKNSNEMEKESEEINSSSCDNAVESIMKKKKSELNEKIKLEGKSGLSSDFDSDCENEKIRSQVGMYQVPQKQALIFHMHHPCTFTFHGELKLTLISGEVEILGLTLSETSIFKTSDVYSPNFFTPLTVESKAPEQSKSKEEIRNNLVDVLSEEDTNKLLCQIQPLDSVLLVEQINSDFGAVINKYIDKPLFPKDLEDVSSLSESLKSLQSIFTFTLSKNSKQIRKNLEWDKIPLSHCTVLCGGKGVGKSTLLKYYLNKLVGQGEKALCLDFDPGQPEFTPPGCVSAVVVDKPLLGPNFTHLIHPKIMVYFGEVDVSQGPAKYLECVNYVIESCRKNEELLKLKWFVNTMGFSKGLGIELMVSILKLLNPNTVIQIKSSDYKKNYPFYLTPSAVNSRKGFSSIGYKDVYQTFDLQVISSCAEQKGKAIQGGLKPRQLRDLMSISYFSQMASPPYYNFNAVQPYLISFSKLYLGIDFLIPPNDILKAFNGNTVSLSCFEPDYEEILSPETDDYFKIVVKPRVASSLGLGFVRGIDCKEKKVYIITHISIKELEKINCLSLGRISPPFSMFLKQDTVEGPTVYTSVSAVDVIQRVKRLFRVPPSQQNKSNVG